MALTRAGAQSIRSGFIVLSWMSCGSSLFWACLFFMRRRARWIFITRAGYPHWLSSLLIPTFGAGAYGVDLFFALSAYLITSLLLRERAATGALDLRGFYLRRILRIWPLYLAFVAFAAVFAALVPGQHLPMKYVVGYSLLAGNWIYVFYGLPASFAVPLWTVSIEEQFYLAWPLALRKASVRAMAIIAVGILVVANAWRVWLAVFRSAGGAH